MNELVTWPEEFQDYLFKDNSSYAIISRNISSSSDVEIFALEEIWAHSLIDLRLHTENAYLLVLPYRLLQERGFIVQNDDAPLRVCKVLRRATIPRGKLLKLLPEANHFLKYAEFDISDESYAETVSQIIKNEIGRGSGSNFVIKRALRGEIPGFHPNDALGYLKNLLLTERGAYWTFLLNLRGLSMMGATPERHVSCNAGHLCMTAISGTLKNHERPEQSKKVLQFVNNAKEREELYMVLDEELKMISRLCPDGGNIAGPTLRYMSKVIHTEYEINGFTTESPLTILVRTMFAPTVVGSPLESAARIVARYEPTPRGYYSGAIALIEPRSDGGEANLDSAILIRTASITPDGKASIPTGATIVRDSNPAAEAEETTAKAASLLSILSERVEAEDDDTKIAAALAARGGQVSSFWQVPAKVRSRIKTSLQGKRCLILNAEDDFTGMIAVILRSAGMDVSIKPVSRVDELDQSDLIVFGPGPGDPNDTGDTRLARLRALMGEALSNKRRFLAVCLSHQVLGLMLGMPVRALPEPRQGRQEEIIICGKKEFAGFYNTFVVETQRNVVNTAWGAVQISRHPNTMQVYALTGDYFSSVQCHLESILTRNGHQLLTQLAEQVLSRADCLAE